jgi:hypothetical protein
MIISIHQPNFLPWVQFFEKIEKSDIFIILKNCQFEKNNYQNRFLFNNIWQTMSVNKGNDFIFNKKYTQPEHDWTKIKKRLFKYEKQLSKFDNCISINLAETNICIIKKVCDILNIKTKIVFDYETELTKSERLVDLCKTYGASTYLSGPSGKKYLNIETFNEAKIKVDFFHSENKKHILEIL